MREQILWIYTYLSIFRIFPAYICFKTNKFRQKCEMDLDVWIEYFSAVSNHSRFWQFGYLIVNQKETRNIFLNRLLRNVLMYASVRLLFKPLDSLYISTPPEKIGGGFSVQHGFSTIVNANSIGERCRVFQQVTVGYRNGENPEIGDDVYIMTGAIVLGGIKIGDRTKIGAGAVVVHDVPCGATAVGEPARIINK